MDSNLTTSPSTLNVNDVNTQLKAGIDILNIVSTRNVLYIQIPKGAKGERMEEIYYADTNGKKVGMAKSI